MSSLAKSPAAFWDRIAARYAKRPVQDMPAYDTTLARTRTYLKDSDRVLEVGCGTGTTAVRLADAVAQITATDFSAEMIRIARAKLTDDIKGKVRFEQADASSDAGLSAPADVVIAFNLLHLIEDPQATVRSLRDQVAPGGHLITKTACLGEKGYLLRILVGVARLFGRAPFVGFLKIDDLEQMIREAGFDIVETGDYPASPPSHFVVARRI